MDDILHNLPGKPTRFMDQFRAFIRSKPLAHKTGNTCCAWVVDSIRYHDMHHQLYLGEIHYASSSVNTSLINWRETNRHREDFIVS